MYSKILVPLDGSKRAEAILPHVQDIARRYNAQVILLRVIEPPVNLTDLVWTVEKQVVDEMTVQAESYLAGLQTAFEAQGIQVRSVVTFGLVVASILETARNENVDLIAMASHGRSGLARVFYGSVAAGVLHGVDRPLLIVRAENEE